MRHKRCRGKGINHITTSYSNPKRNADAERFFRTFKEEIIEPEIMTSMMKQKNQLKNLLSFITTIILIQLLDILVLRILKNKIFIQKVA